MDLWINRDFHVVVVEKREIKGNFVVLLIKPIVFLTFSLLSASLGPKVPTT